MENTLITVIVPVFRVEKFLERCLESIINQSYRNLEIILVDDGSDDSCPDICDKYSKIDKRIIVYHKLNGGLSDARNYGIEKSHGEYLFFIDSDDYIDENMIKNLYDALEKNHSDISMCSFCYVDECGVLLLKQNELSTVGSFSNEEIFKMYDQNGVSWILGVAWNKLYKKTLFDDIRYPYGKLHEDNFISFLIYNEAKKITIIEDRLYFYTQRNQSIMGNKFNVRHADGAIAALNRIDFAIKTDRLFLIPKAEQQAFGILFDTSLNIKTNDERQYIKPIIEQYASIFYRIKTLCNLNCIKYIKRKILIRNGFCLKICKVLFKIKNRYK